MRAPRPRDTQGVPGPLRLTVCFHVGTLPSSLAVPSQDTPVSPSILWPATWLRLKPAGPQHPPFPLPVWVHVLTAVWGHIPLLQAAHNPHEHSQGQDHTPPCTGSECWAGLSARVPLGLRAQEHLCGLKLSWDVPSPWDSGTTAAFCGHGGPCYRISLDSVRRGVRRDLEGPACSSVPRRHEETPYLGQSWLLASSFQH